MRKGLEEKLVEGGLISKDQCQIVFQKAKESQRPIWQVLIDLNLVTREKLKDFMDKFFHIPSLEKISEDIVDPKVIEFIPEEVVRKYSVMPLFRTEDRLTLAMIDPLNVLAIDEIQSRVNCQVDVVLGFEEEIKKAIDSYYGAGTPLKKVIEGMKGTQSDSEIAEKEKGPSEAEIAVDDAPVVKLVDTMIIEAIKKRASDIHIEPAEDKLRMRYRIDGVLQETVSPPKRFQSVVISRVKIMAGMDIAEKRVPQDGRFNAKVEKRDIDVRVSTIPTMYGEKVVMRLLDQSSSLLKLEDLGFEPEVLTEFEKLIRRPYGIIIVTGPTGSGKTTTLYVSIERINSIEKNIVTIEDPIEYNLKGVNQIPIKPKAGVTFATALRTVLRQDPDIIMVGEMRDIETAETAIRAALTGHLVFTTLHTNDAPSSLTRMVDMGIPAYLVASAVSAVLAQRLVRNICPNCKEKIEMESRIVKELGLSAEPDKPYTLYRGKGCDKCNGQGYYGRTGIFELMFVNEEIRRLLVSQSITAVLREAAKRSGMKTLWETGMEKALQGITTVEEVKRTSLMEE